MFPSVIKIYRFFGDHFFFRNSPFYGGLALVFWGMPTAAVFNLASVVMFLIVVILFNSGR